MPRISFRPILDILQRRVVALHDALLQAGVTPPSMDEEDEQQANKALDTVDLPKLPSEALVFSSTGGDGSQHQVTDLTGLGESESTMLMSGEITAPHAPEDSLQADTSLHSNLEQSLDFGELYSINWEDTVSPDWDWMNLFPAGMDTLTSAQPFAGLSNTLPRPPGRADGLVLPAITDNNHDDEVDPELIGQVAARFGSLHVAPDGKLRYFGTPSNTHLFGSSYSGPYSSPRSVRIDGAHLLRNADLDRQIDPELETHLIELFFSWHNSCNPVVGKSMYWSAREQAHEGIEDGGYYSEVLTNAMFVWSSDMPTIEILTSFQVCNRCQFRSPLPFETCDISQAAGRVLRRSLQNLAGSRTGQSLRRHRAGPAVAQ